MMIRLFTWVGFTLGLLSFARAQTSVGVAYTFATCRAERADIEGMNEFMPGRSTAVFARQRFRRFGLEASYFTGTYHPKLDQRFIFGTVTGSGFAPQHTEGFHLALLYFILPKCLYLKYGYGLATSTAPAYFFTTAMQRVEVQSSRVWGGGTVIGSGCQLDIGKHLQVYVELTYFNQILDPDVTFKKIDYGSGRVWERHQDETHLWFMNFNMGCAWKIIR